MASYTFVGIALCVCALLRIASAHAGGGAQSAQFYFVRHGETEGNAAGIMQGQCDYPLTKEGVSQARLVGLHLSQVSFRCVWCSDLGRARQTCSLLLSQHSQHSQHAAEPNPDPNPNPHAQPRFSHLLRELRFGVREQLPRGTSPEAAKAQVAARLGIAEGAVVDSAESPDELAQRQELFLHDALDGLWEGGGGGEGPNPNPTPNQGGGDGVGGADGPPRVLCVSHGAFIRGLLERALGVMIPSIKNCSVSVVTVRREGGRLFFSCDASELNMDAHINGVTAAPHH